MNLSTQPQRINKGAKLARCEILSADCTVKTDGGGDLEVIGAVQTLGKDTQLPQHLTDLYDHSTKSLSKSESSEVFKLLCEFADIFSTDPSDLACIDLVH